MKDSKIKVAYILMLNGEEYSESENLNDILSTYRQLMEYGKDVYSLEIAKREICPKITLSAKDIEKLCDEIIAIETNDREIMCDSDKDWLSEGNVFLDVIYYGAIWTEKGLIYVAKLNNKNGEWELL